MVPHRNCQLWNKQWHNSLWWWISWSLYQGYKLPWLDWEKYAALSQNCLHTSKKTCWHVVKTMIFSIELTNKFNFNGVCFIQVRPKTYIKLIILRLFRGWYVHILNVPLEAECSMCIYQCMYMWKDWVCTHTTNPESKPPFFCLPLGFPPVVGPTEWWCCLRHLARLCYVALGRALICGCIQNYTQSC